MFLEELEQLNLIPHPNKNSIKQKAPSCLPYLLHVSAHRHVDFM